MLKPRERMALALDHRNPDRVPLDFGSSITSITVEAYENLKRHLGVSLPTRIIGKALETAEVDEEVLGLLGIDTRYLRPILHGPLATEVLVDEGYTDEWGIRWRRSAGGRYYDIVASPLRDADLVDLSRYRWPATHDPEALREVKAEAKRLLEQTDYALVADPLAPAIFEPAWYLRGLDQFLTDLVLDRAFADRLLGNILQHRLEFFEAFLDAVGNSVQVVVLGDDLGMQDRPLLSPSLYREMIKPRHRELFQFIKSRTKAKIFLHSCGSIIDLIDDLLDAGVDILHPLQTTAARMEPEELKRRFGDRLVFWGAVDIQRVLPAANDAEFEAYLQRIIGSLGRQGGFVLAPGHNIQADTSAERIVSLFRTAMRFGEYGRDN
ncbi:MAG: uroporphyrinogen decarboxylase family protein [Patescibacteria group bacterium]